MNFHVVTQGKGGVGKSVISYLLAQYLKSVGRPVKCVDTDPVNKTFTGFKALDVTALELIVDKKINPNNFDALVSMAEENSADIVVDNGASSFLPLNDYMISMEFSEMLSGVGQQLFIHVPIAGADMQLDTMNGFVEIAKQHPANVNIIVWLNENWGPIEHEGKPFEKLKGYTENKDAVNGIVTLPQLSETFSAAFTDLLADKLLFDERINDEKLTVPDKQRLKIVQKKYFTPIDLVLMQYQE